MGESVGCGRGEGNHREHKERREGEEKRILTG